MPTDRVSNEEIINEIKGKAWGHKLYQNGGRCLAVLHVGCASCGPYSGKLHQVVFVAQGWGVKHCHQYLGCSWFLPIPTRFQVTTGNTLFLKQLSYLILGEKLGCTILSNQVPITMWKAPAGIFSVSGKHILKRNISSTNRRAFQKKSTPLQWVFLFGKYIKICASALHGNILWLGHSWNKHPS